MIAATALALASALATAVAPSGNAPPGATPAAAPATEVIARVRSAPGVNVACLREAVTGFLAGRGIPVRWPSGDAPPAAPLPARRLSLEIDLTNPARAALTFTDSAGGTPQVRELALAHGLDPIGCESLADVIEASVLALTATAPAPPEPGSVPAPAAVEPAAPGPAIAPTSLANRPDAALRGEHLALAIAYTLEPAASDILQSGLELALGSRPGRARRRHWLRVAYAFPVMASAAGASASWQSVSAAWGMSVSSRGRHAWFEVGSGFGINLTFVETRSPVGGTSVASDRQTQIAPFFGPQVTVAVPVAPSAVLHASLRLSFVGAPPVMLEANGMTVFESLWMFRPALVVGGRWQ